MREEHCLTFQFHGICTHFRYGVAAGVPHRVVLPDAAHLRMGMLNLPGVTSEPVSYYLTPHFPRLAFTSGHGDLCVDGWIDEYGNITSGVRLQVLNACDTEMTYDCSDIRRLTEFVPHYNFAADVVLGGRAACYLDLYGGTAWTSKAGDFRPHDSFIEITTDGPPELLISPLLSSGQPGKSCRRILSGEGNPPKTRLHVMNLEAPKELITEENLGMFDYLFHYLTARGGIPQTIVCPTPGMNKTLLKPVNQAKLADAVAIMSQLVREWRRGSPPIEQDISPACADSHYP